MPKKLVAEPRRNVNFHARDVEIVRWKEAAYQRRMSFSAWIREMLDAGSVDLPAPPPPKLVEHPAPPKVLNEAKLGEEMLARLTPPGECLRRIAKGSFCKSCGRLH